MTKNFAFATFVSVLFFGCKSTSFVSHHATDPSIRYFGRTVAGSQQEQILIGSASYAEFMFGGDSCVVMLKNIAGGDNHNYISIELDNQYKERLKVDGKEPKTYTIKASSGKSPHLLRIYKATEAQNGQVAITGVSAASLQQTERSPRKKIEFIGNSITCGMGNDISTIPCGSGQWYDQHNAYFAYGPLAARSLNADFMLSSVSGIGIYRTWNMEKPGMPSVYESAYLHTDSAQRWGFSNYIPDVVSICLGTNDLSDGDGQNPRAKFDSGIFVQQYTGFVGTIYKNYPNTKVVLLTSPMLSGAKDELLYKCLSQVRENATRLYPGKKPIEIFRFKPMVPKGCSYHPSKEDHETMAAEITPFLEKALQ